MPDVILSQEALHRAVQVFKQACSAAGKSGYTITQDILLEAAGDALTVRGTDLAVAVTFRANAQVKTPFALCVPARQFAEYVAALPPDTVALTHHAKTDTLKIECARFEAKFKGADASEFPLIPSGAAATAVSINTARFKEMVAQVQFATAGESDPREVLHCVSVIADGQGVTFASADGYRLAMASNPREELPMTRGNFEVLVPARALRYAAKLANDDEEFVSFGLVQGAPANLIFRFARVELVAWLGAGNFPDFTQIVPKHAATRAVLNLRELQNALTAARVFAVGETRSVRFSITPETADAGARCTVESQSQEGDQTGTLDVTCAGEGATFALNASMLKQCLDAWNAPQIVIETNGTGTPVVLKPLANQNYTYVQMPLVR